MRTLAVGMAALCSSASALNVVDAGVASMCKKLPQQNQDSSFMSVPTYGVFDGVSSQLESRPYSQTLAKTECEQLNQSPVQHRADLELQRRRIEQLRPALRRRRDVGFVMVEEEDDTVRAGQQSLEDKMASWDASAEEQRASTLGGNLPLVGMPGLPGRMTRTDQPDKVDGFDLGMNISGLILFPLAIALFSVPFWIGNIDVSDVGPPPMS